MTQDRKHEVLIIQTICPEYRVPFFEALRKTLGQHGINLRFSHGLPPGQQHKLNYGGSKSLLADLPWADKSANFYGPAGTVIHKCWHLTKNADLVIAPHEARDLIIYPLLIRMLLGGAKVAFWGHGWNGQRGIDSPGQRFKIWLAKRAHWFFAYTKGGRDQLVARGLDSDRVTIVQNAVDLPPRLVDEGASGDARRHWGIADDRFLGVYCGNFGRFKNLPLLISTAKLIHERNPGFTLLIGGDGPDRMLVEEAAASTDYIIYAGPILAKNKPRFYAGADIILAPGRIGLNILDSFHYRVPIVVCERSFHGSEFEYVENGENALVVSEDAHAVADAAESLRTDSALRNRIVGGCERTAKILTLDAMTSHFVAGIVGALKTPKGKQRGVAGAGLGYCRTKSTE